jgi:hypothetical protein
VLHLIAAESWIHATPPHQHMRQDRVAALFDNDAGSGAVSPPAITR